MPWQAKLYLRVFLFRLCWCAHCIHVSVRLSKKAKFGHQNITRFHLTSGLCISQATSGLEQRNEMTAKHMRCMRTPVRLKISWESEVEAAEQRRPYLSQHAYSEKCTFLIEMKTGAGERMGIVAGECFLSRDKNCSEIKLKVIVTRRKHKNPHKIKFSKAWRCNEYPFHYFQRTHSFHKWFLWPNPYNLYAVASGIESQHWGPAHHSQSRPCPSQCITVWDDYYGQSAACILLPLVQLAATHPYKND